MGTVVERRPAGGTQALVVKAAVVFGDLKTGDSVSVNGACLTVEEIRGDTFKASLSGETVAKTTLGTLRSGSRVNLERALVYGERMGGHFLLGHVDGTGTVTSRDIRGDTGTIAVRFPAGLRKYLFPKCSVGLDGISLTVAELTGAAFTAWLVPYTLRHTTLAGKQAGATVNIEADMLVKAVVDRTKGNERNAKISRTNYL